MAFALLASFGVMFMFGLAYRLVPMPKLLRALQDVYERLPDWAERHGGEPARHFMTVVLAFSIMFIAPANLWYTFGWVIEVIVRAVMSDAPAGLGALMFRAGLALSVLLLLAVFMFLFNASVQARVTQSLTLVLDRNRRS